MTDYSTMLQWFTPEPDVLILHCDECGAELVSPDGRQRTMLCPECKAQRRRESAMRCNRNKGKVRYDFEDPEVSLVYAVLERAIEDAEWQRRYNPDGQELDIAECEARDFIEDGGAELWLRALGIGLQPSLAKRLYVWEG